MEDFDGIARTSDLRLEDAANRITGAMWWSLITGIAIGCCMCGMIDHLKETSIIFHGFFRFLYTTYPWWIWTIPLILLFWLFWFSEKIYREKVLNVKE